MTPAEQLRAQADADDVEQRRLRAAAESAPPPASWKLADLALHIRSRSWLLQRCAVSADRCGADLWAEDNARFDEVVEPLLASERAAREQAQLSVRAAWERTEREAPELLRRWQRRQRA